ncbi:hypothetical protein FB451DRAFT_1261544 [Mycena latifolia]|nr:hypothetical protein FB451DRAFT_1261544 [Mycena latifolia]
MPLHSLNSDVLLLICTFLDVFTILSLSRVNKYLGVVVSSKQLWISIVRDLSSRYLIDPPAEEHLQRLSTAELMEQVKRGVVGPLTWSPASLIPPTLSREINISLETLQGEWSQIEFLPEGRHILFYKDSGAFPDGVECWEVRRGRRVWGWSSPGYHVGHATFDFRGRSKAVVSIESYALGNRTIILEADFQTGESRVLLHLPTAAPSWPPETQLSGDFLTCICGIFTQPAPFMLMNWRTAEFILFDPSNLKDVKLFPNHIALLCHDFSTPDYVRIVNMASFGHLWRPLSEFTLDHFMDHTKIPYIAVDVPGIGEPRDRCPITKIHAAKTPLHDECYELLVEVTDRDTTPCPSLLRRIRNRLINTPVPLRSKWIITVARYRLPLPPSSPVILQPLTTLFRHPKHFRRFTIMHQYGFSWSIPKNGGSECTVYQLSEAGIRHPRALPFPWGVDVLLPAPQISRTGAMMALMGHRVLVWYYL